MNALLFLLYLLITDAFIRLSCTLVRLPLRVLADTVFEIQCTNNSKVFRRRLFENMNCQSAAIFRYLLVYLLSCLGL
jgi:hypothetical protein